MLKGNTNIGGERNIGEINRGYLPSPNDIDQAFLENKNSGTIFNVAVSINGIYFYNANYGFDFHR